MTEKIQSIPARIKNIAKGGHVAGTEDIIDDVSGKTQKEINTETGNKVDALQKQDIEAVTSLPAVSSADPKKIYRVAGETSYTDYMLNAAGTQFVAIATYSFPGIDDEPTAGSNNLVKSGGVAIALNKVSEVSKERISEENDSISVEDEEGNTVIDITPNGVDAKNLKNNGVDVATVNDLETKQDHIPELHEETSFTEDTEVIIGISNNDRTATFADKHTTLEGTLTLNEKRLGTTTNFIGNYSKSIKGGYNFLTESFVLNDTGVSTSIFLPIQYEGIYKWKCHTSFGSHCIVDKDGFILQIFTVSNYDDYRSEQTLVVSDTKAKFFVMWCANNGIIQSYFKSTTPILIGRDVNDITSPFPIVPIKEDNKSLNLPILTDNPLEKIQYVPGFTSIVSDWGFIGDSLSSGELGGYRDGELVLMDVYKYSWGQRLCALCGTKGYNYSNGGQTAKGWIQQTATVYNDDIHGVGGGSWAKCKTERKDAYIIALGENDVTMIQQGTLLVGDTSTDIGEYDSTNDTDTNSDTFAGYYAGIIQRLRSLGDMPIFCATLPRMGSNNENRQLVNNVIRNICEIFDDVYLIDRYKYEPIEVGDNYSNLFMNTHKSEFGYQYDAYLYCTYINWIICNNIASFKGIGLWKLGLTLNNNN